ncbi:MAG: HU family DNA-binding protein [Magnetococcales bacterium]|nr:HU family DNA-binding protein [Magnetococcales bacterium]
MNKSELTAKVAETTGMTSAQAEQAINALVATVKETLASGGQVTLVGFGSFSVAERAARTGRNPRTGAAIQIAANRVPLFKAGQTLKAAVALKPVVPEVVVAAKTAESSKPKKDGKKK